MSLSTNIYLKPVLCAYHHTWPLPITEYVIKASSTQWLQELSFHSLYCFWETPGCVGSLPHHYNRHHDSWDTYFFMPKYEASHSPEQVMGRGQRRKEWREYSPSLHPPSPPPAAATFPVPAVSSLVKMLTMTFVCVQEEH